MIIGICGKSGSGKSRLAKEIIKLSTKEVVHLDIDKVGHNALNPIEAKLELVKLFGEEVVKDDLVDRKKLGSIVFNSKNEMNKLIDVTWKYMQLEIDKFLTDNKDKVVILDWQLLPKTDYFNKCDIKILLDVPYEVRKMRAIKRDNISETDFKLREKASLDINNYEFDYVLNNCEDENIKRLVKLYE